MKSLGFFHLLTKWDEPPSSGIWKSSCSHAWFGWVQSPHKSIKKLHLGALAKGVHRISRNELDGAVQEIPSVNGRESCENWRQRNPENIPNRSGTGI